MRALNLLIKEWISFLQEALDIVVVSDVDCLRFGLVVSLSFPFLQGFELLMM